MYTIEPVRVTNVHNKDSYFLKIHLKGSLVAIIKTGLDTFNVIDQQNKQNEQNNAQGGATKK